MNFITETLSFLSSDPLFLTILSIYSLALLYSPPLFLHFILSPAAFTTLILLLYLLRLGATQTQRTETDSEIISESVLQQESLNPDQDCLSGPDPNPVYSDSFVEWDVRAPLEVIYEEHDEGEDENIVSEAKRESEMNVIQRYASLSLFYPESDSDGSSEGEGGWDSPENVCFRWEENGGDGLIEIELDGKKKKRRSTVEDDEENLIEIDLSPAR